jgi:hypothetical protein
LTPLAVTLQAALGDQLRFRFWDQEVVVATVLGFDASSGDVTIEVVESILPRATGTGSMLVGTTYCVPLEDIDWCSRDSNWLDSSRDTNR